MQDREGYSTEEKEGRVGAPALIVAALAVLVLYTASVVAIGTPPSAADTGEQVAVWFREHGAGARWSVWALTVSIPPFAVMFALLRRLLPAPHRDVFLIGAVIFVVTTAVQTWTWGGLALHGTGLVLPPVQN